MTKRHFPAQLVISFAALACLTVTNTCFPAPAGEKIDETAMENALLAHVRPLMDSLREKNVKVVGVLKFVVKREGQDLSSSEGTLNMRLAEKTEVALTFANPPSEKDFARQICVAKNATEIAEKIPGATHLFNDDKSTKENLSKRDKLFSAKYNLAWELEGQSEAVPDAFVFGVAIVHKNRQDVDIQLNAFVKGQAEVIHGEQFSTFLDAADLRDLGESFFVSREVTNRTADDTSTYNNEALESAVKSSSTPKLHILQNQNTPVQLEIFYNEEKQEVTFLNSQSEHGPGAFVKDPSSGQKVRFVVSRRDPEDKTRYGILLRVNGENSLYRERLPDDRCHLWVLDPNAKAIQVSGYQKIKGSEGEAEPFLVVEGKKAMDAAEFYGHNAGLITLTVYAERSSDKSRESIPPQEVVSRTIQETVLPVAVAKNLSQLNGNMTNSVLGEIKTRGIIVADSKETVKTATVEVEFDREDRPFFFATVRYYKP